MPDRTSTAEANPAAGSLAHACQVESDERNGFKAIVFRLHGDGYFSECRNELKALVRSHKPSLDPDGSVSHFLLFDAARKRNL